jgi:hypothetical protein
MKKRFVEASPADKVSKKRTTKEWVKGICYEKEK